MQLHVLSFSLKKKEEERKEKKGGGKKTSKKIFKKCSHTQHGVYSVLASYSRAWELPWSVVDRHFIGEIDFLFILRHLLHMVPRLRWGFVSTSSLWEVSANTMINRVSIHMRPGGNPVQYGLVVRVASNFESSIPSSLF